jgi:exopolysaccharide production protein ExoQ
MIALLIWPTMYVLLRRGHRLLAGLTVAAGLALIGQRENTASLLAAAVALVVFVAALASTKWTARTLAVLVLVGVALMPFAPTTVLEPNRVARLVPGIEMPHFHRLVIWRFVAERIAKRPVTGWGLNASRSIPGGDDTVSLVLEGREEDGAAADSLRQSVMEQLPLHPHSAALQWWLELGAVGALLGAGLLVALILASRGRSPASRGQSPASRGRGVGRAEVAATLALMTAAISVSMLSYNIWQSWSVAALWLCAALVLAVRRGDRARD